VAEIILGEKILTTPSKRHSVSSSAKELKFHFRYWTRVQRVQTGPGAQSASYSVNTGVSFTGGVKIPGREANHTVLLLPRLMPGALRPFPACIGTTPI
jgi:hypothetical protein